ncbi:MAG: non-ribosomal peptide synthetase [Bacillales bacterium]|nr:non-ribosomal peptide synthetase [Bacillales bacterium]
MLTLSKIKEVKGLFMKSPWVVQLDEFRKKDFSFKSIYEDMMERHHSHTFAEYQEKEEIKTLSYSDLDIMVKKAANALSFLLSKTKKDSFVGLSLKNSPEWVAVFYGLLMAGYNPLLLDPSKKSEEINDIMKTAGAAMLISEGENKDISLDDIFNKSYEEIKPVWADKFALHTSGTTGSPKVFVYDGVSMSSQLYAAREIVLKNKMISMNDKGKRAKIIALVPFFHIFGFMGTFLWYTYLGGEIIFLKSLSSEDIKNTIINQKVSHIFAVPLIYDSVATKIVMEAKKTNSEEKLYKAIDASISLQKSFPVFGQWLAQKVIFRKINKNILGLSLIFMISGGGHIKDETLRIMNGLGYPLYQGYGMSEANIVSLDYSKKITDRIENSIGKPFEIYSYELSSEGDLKLKGDSLSIGRMIDGKLIKRDKSDFFDTLDVFDCLDNQKLSVKYRKDDIIVAENGENYSPFELEDKLSSPYLERCVVYQDSVDKKINLLLKENINTDPYQKVIILNETKKNIEKLPLGIRIDKIYITTSSLPEAIGGKIQRFKVERMIKEGKIKVEEIEKKNKEKTKSDKPISPVTKDIIDIFARVYNLNPEDISPDTQCIQDLGSTSMDYIYLVNEIADKYGIVADFEHDAICETPESFAEYIENKISS